MGCGGDREKQVAKEHQWGYFNLSDFKSNSCWAPFSYAILYISLIVSVACYVLDVLTCSQLIVSDKWSGQIEISPLVPFEIARWIFTGCILLSFALLGYRWWKAIRAIKSGSVVASYMDPLAVRVQSIRMGQGQGWRRFLVFAALTKSKKGAEYVALFSYFSFEASLRILLAEGPRQVINGITIYSIMRSKIIPIDGNAAPLGHSPIVQFFLNVKVLAEGNTLRAVVFFGMVFTIIIWVLALLSLIFACIFYVVFLWHHIPSGSGGLGGYCKKKVDSKLQSIVDAKIKKAFDREEKMRQREEAKAAKSGQPIQPMKTQPSLPVLTSTEDKLPDMPTISRQNTFTTLPEYESRPGTPSTLAQSAYGENLSRPGMPSRSVTQASSNSYASSNAPLMGGAAPMGYSQPPRGHSPTGSMASGPPRLGRSLTNQTHSSQGSHNYDPRANQNQGRPMGQLSRQNTDGSRFGPDRQFTPAPSMRSYTPMSEMRAGGGSQVGPERQFTPAPSMRSNTPMGDPRSDNRSQFGPDRHFTPVPSIRSDSPMGQPQYAPGPPRRQNTNGSNQGSHFGGSDRSDAASVMSASSSYSRRPIGPPGNRSQLDNGGIEMQNRPLPTSLTSNLRPYSPALSAPGQGPRLPFTGPGRNFSSPYNQVSSDSFDRPNPPQRSGTAPPQNLYSNSSYENFPRPGPPARSATGPSYEEWPQHGL